MVNTTKSLQTETPYITKQRQNRLWLTRFAILIVIGFVLYFGYCWGLWGRGSLLLQYLFQCSCPPASEEARYPDDVDVIVPACRPIGVKLSPSGRLLYVFEREYNPTSTYLLNLQTEEKSPFFIPNGSNYFLTDDLLYLSLFYGQGYEGGEYLLDRTTGKQYPIQQFVYSRTDARINGETNLTLLAESLRQAEHVFLIGNSADTVVALASEFYSYPERNFTTNMSDIPGSCCEQMEGFLRENNIAYQTTLPDFPGEMISQDGRFVARPDGIYLVDDEKKIVEGYSVIKWFSRKYYEPRGWIYDGSGVIYKKFLNPCLIEPIYFTPCFFEVPQPLLKLNVPEEYLLPAPP